MQKVLRYDPWLPLVPTNMKDVCSWYVTSVGNALISNQKQLMLATSQGWQSKNSKQLAKPVSAGQIYYTSLPQHIWNLILFERTFIHPARSMRILAEVSICSFYKHCPKKSQILIWSSWVSKTRSLKKSWSASSRPVMTVVQPLFNKHTWGMRQALVLILSPTTYYCFGQYNETW